MSANAYSFLPWLRTGIATRITADPGTADRASIPVKLLLTADKVGGGTITKDVERTVQIYGPGDVVGVDPRAISRTEPRPWITNVEPNYLVHIEFYDEDFPWRYSPAAPDETTRRLRPWLALIVLAGGADPKDSPGAEFTEGALPDRPLPFIEVTDPDGTLSPSKQLGAWSHVHVNGGLDAAVASNDVSAALPNLSKVLRANADNACSRLLCPRGLLPNTGYHAFLVPAFETGRLAGLGLDPAAAPGALHASWGEAPYDGELAAGTLPYYHRWFFATGAAGDFEYLVRLLVPGVPDKRVARRDFDVHRSAGPGLPGIPAPKGGVLRLGGALQIPGRTQDEFDTWDQKNYPHAFQKALAGLINLADDYTEEHPIAAHVNLAATAGPAAQAIAGQADPLITPPLYGRWHALTSRLLTERDGTPVPEPTNRNWVHRLNLDPRFRIAANFGTQVVQRRQEEFMAAAWAQVGDVLAANNKIRAAQLAREVGHVLQVTNLDPNADAGGFPSGRALALTAPANSRVTESAGTAALTDAVENITVGFRVAGSQVAATPLSPAMRRITRPGSRLMRALPFDPANPPEALVRRMDEDDPVAAAAPKTTPSAVVTADRVNEALPPLGPGGDPVEDLPTSSNFVITLPGDSFQPTSAAEDSDEAKNFKDALRDLYRGWDAASVAAQVSPRQQLNVEATTGSMLAGLRADDTVPRYLLSSVRLPEQLPPVTEQLIEAMAYPSIDLPMYQALLDISVDVFVPNLNLIAPNTITLLETNQEFIESFLVGLNHEMARELLWREYPTDQRGTPFRQFWDPRTALSPPGETPAERRKRLYDIRPIDAWGKAGLLGFNDNRDVGGEQEKELVLVIRGELLKKYPTAAIYAHRARWQLKNQQPDRNQERVPIDLADPEHPREDEIKLPLYEAKVEPDIYLLGFDLTAEAARGQNDDAGWFFVIKERPGDLRFGLDIGPSTRVEVWNDLTWNDADPHDLGFIQVEDSTTPPLEFVTVPLLELDSEVEDAEKKDQHEEDRNLPAWTEGLSSADIAYILFQAPVLMAVHAEEMLA